jgi:signal transduction histidine kinase/Tfp pilus assembly protein PilF
MSYPCIRFCAFLKCVLILNLLVPISASARKPNLDSLVQVLANRKNEDTVKVRLYAATAIAYRWKDVDSVKTIADKGIALAERLHFDKGLVECLINKTIGNLMSMELDDAMANCERSISILAKTNDTVAMANPYFFIAAIYYQQSKFDKAIEYYLKTVRIERNTTNYDRLGSSLDNIGVAYGAIGNFSESLKYYLEALKVREKQGHEDGKATSLANIGRVYASLGNNKKATEYIKRSLSAQDKMSPESLLLTLENAGSVYLTVADTMGAIDAFERAIQLADSIHLVGMINRILVNTAEVYSAIGNFEKAHELYKRCLANTSMPNSPAVDAMIHWGLGRIYADKKQTKMAIKELETAVTMFVENDMKDQLTEALKQLGGAYYDAHDYAKAYDAMVRHDAYKDTILSEATKQKAQELQYEYDLQKKQTEIELLAKDNTIAQSRAEKQNAISLGLVSGLVLLVVIVATMYRSKQREKATTALIVNQAANLTELNSYKDKIFSVLAHDLRGPISALATCVGMLDDKVITPAEFSELKPMLDQQLSSVTLLLDNLLKWSVNHIKAGKSVRKEIIDVQNLTTQNLRLMHQIVTEKGITIRNEVAPGVMATGDQGNIDIIIRNLLSNAFKFTHAGGTVTISADVSGGLAKISVTDDGVGMTEEQMKKLFTAAPDNSSVGTGGERGIGLGLLMCYEFAKANNGDIKVSSSPGKGSTFTLVLPA